MIRGKMPVRMDRCYCGDISISGKICESCRVYFTRGVVSLETELLGCCCEKDSFRDVEPENGSLGQITVS